MDTSIGARFLVEPAIWVHFDAGWPFPKSSQGTHWALKNESRGCNFRVGLLLNGKRGSSWVVADPSISLRAEEVQNQVLSLRPPSLRFPLWKISRSTYETRITMEMPCFSNPCRIVYPSLNLGLIFHSSPSPSLPPVTLWPQRRHGHHTPMDL